MPPVHETHTVYRVQNYLSASLVPPLFSTLERRVLEHQTNAVVSHVCAYIDCEQCKCHAHDHRDEDEIQSGDLKHVTIRVRVLVYIFILLGQAQDFGIPIFIMPLLLYKFKVELPQ